MCLPRSSASAPSRSSRRNRSLRAFAWGLCLPLFLGSVPPTLHAAGPGEIPYFARKYGLSCADCHVSPPKLNEFGEGFVRANYRLPDREPRGTLPLAIWVSARADLPPAAGGLDREVRGYLNRLEVISGGRVAAPWLAYFVEWRPISFELQADRTLRDRSGRFEDLFLIAEFERLELWAGQFRQVTQVDISRRLGVSEPAFFSRSLPGEGGGSARDRSLRAFSLSGRSPTLRAGWVQSLGRGSRWMSYASIPFPGELSLPLTREARREASNELERSAKGVFLETFFHRGLFSHGAHLFLDSRDRYQFGTVTTGARGPWMWTGAAGAAGLDGSLRGRWSAEGERVLVPSATVGARGEGEAGRDPALVAYGNFHFPGTTWTLRLTVEQRMQAGRGTTLVELGAVF
jgi:hypothetical protein